MKNLSAKPKDQQPPTQDEPEHKDDQVEGGDSSSEEEEEDFVPDEEDEEQDESSENSGNEEESDEGNEDAEESDDSEGTDEEPEGDDSEESGSEESEGDAGNEGESEGEKPKEDESYASDSGTETINADITEAKIDANPTEFFKPEYVPGTQEYIDRLTNEATKEACRRLGIKEDEFDPYDRKHSGAFNFSFSRIDQQASAQFEHAKKSVVAESAQRKAAAEFNAAKDKAGSEIDKILNTKELKDKFVVLLEKAPYKQVTEAQKAAREKKDFSFFLTLAKTAAGSKANLEKVNQGKPQPKNQATREKARGDSGRQPVGSEILGF